MIQILVKDDSERIPRRFRGSSERIQRGGGEGSGRIREAQRGIGVVSESKGARETGTERSVLLVIICIIYIYIYIYDTARGPQTVF